MFMPRRPDIETACVGLPSVRSAISRAAATEANRNGCAPDGRQQAEGTRARRRTLEIVPPGVTRQQVSSGALGLQHRASSNDAAE
jgi:hypothetical protein